MTKFAGEKLPTGSRYLPIILSCTLVYLASYFTLRSLAQNPTRTSIVTPILALGGLYHPAYWRLSTAGALITLVAPLLSYDFVYRAHFLHPSQYISFARVGWVTEMSASLLLRSTVPDQVDVSYWSSHDSSAVLHVELSQSSLKTDFTSRLYIEDLQPGITYFYNSTAGHKRSLTTRRSKHDQKQFNFLSTSCQKSDWPYNPLSYSLAISGLEHVDKVARKMERKPEAILFLGDFVCECHIIIFPRRQTQTYHTLPPTIPHHIIADFTARSILAHLGPHFFVQFPGCTCLTTMRSLTTMPLPLLHSPTCSYKPSIHS